MAKKKVAKKVKKEKVLAVPDEYPFSLSDKAIQKAVDSGELELRVDPIKEINERIDRIVAAIDKSRSVKGL